MPWLRVDAINLDAISRANQNQIESARRSRSNGFVCEEEYPPAPSETGQ